MTDNSKTDFAEMALVESIRRGKPWTVSFHHRKGQGGYAEKIATESVEPVRLVLIEEIVDADTKAAVKS